MSPIHSALPQTYPSLITIIKSAKKPENFWFRVYYGVGSFVVWIALRLGLTPNQLTVTGAVLNLAAFGYFWTVHCSRQTIIIAYILLNLAHIFDCADGQLAFVAKMRSELGCWLDSSLDAFKCGYVALLLIKVISAPTAYPAGNWLDRLAICAALGNLVNYTVTVHALRYRNVTDGYQQTSFDAVLPARGLERYFSEAIISHLREYGNLLLAFLLFAANRELALWCVITLGYSHFFFALRRIATVSRRLRA